MRTYDPGLIWNFQRLQDLYCSRKSLIVAPAAHNYAHEWLFAHKADYTRSSYLKLNAVINAQFNANI